MYLHNVKTVRKCAFCKHWYDPTNSAISPKKPQINLWLLVEPDSKKMCMKMGHEMKATAICEKYECKV